MRLDKEQTRVVDCDESIICIAGPGSGKTRVLTEKAAVLVGQRQDIICLTFTRSAAHEIRERIPGIMAGTIHSFCHSFVGWEEGTEYDDLLTRYLQRGSDKFDWVLVDEFQDLTTTQLSVVLSLVGRKIFVVGDPYQSIYGYGGAMGIDAFDAVRQSRQSSGDRIREFVLHNNYRSNRTVVRELNEVYDRRLVSKGINSNGLTSVLCRTNDAVKSVSETLKSAGIGHMIRSGSKDLSRRKEVFLGSRELIVSTIHVSKGLEFDHVVLYGWSPRIPYTYSSRTGSPVEERNVYYVANSRAAESFHNGIGKPDDLLKLLGELIPNLGELKYVPRKRDEGSGEMARLQSVWVDPDWYFTLKPYLERASRHPDKRVASTARTALAMLRLGERQFNEGARSQITLTNAQLKLLSSLTEEMGMEEAYRRFSIAVR